MFLLITFNITFLSNWFRRNCDKELNIRINKVKNIVGGIQSQVNKHLFENITNIFKVIYNKTILSSNIHFSNYKTCIKFKGMTGKYYLV